jgi:hypothetical protein
MMRTATSPADTAAQKAMVAWSPQGSEVAEEDGRDDAGGGGGGGAQRRQSLLLLLLLPGEEVGKHEVCSEPCWRAWSR